MNAWLLERTVDAPAMSIVAKTIGDLRALSWSEECSMDGHSIQAARNWYTEGSWLLCEVIKPMA